VRSSYDYLDAKAAGKFGRFLNGRAKVRVQPAVSATDHKPNRFATLALDADGERAAPWKRNDA
jgi:hypothetical protein